MSKANIKFTKIEAERIYYEMLLARKFEEKCAALYAEGKIAGFCHLYIGQEAVAIGFNHIKLPQDTHITSYRCHAHALIQGKIPAKNLMAELTGRATGCSKGKGGSMHIYSKENGFFGGNGIVGAQIPLGAGLAFAHKHKKDNGVSFSYMGDGALPQGQVYEAFNLASLWKLPAVFIVENNEYSMGTPLNKTHANTNLVVRGEPFGIPGEVVDGMDILDVIEKGTRAVEHARSGKGPYFLEVKTYRYRGHSMSDPQKYRTKDEVENIRQNKDPIDHFATYALSNKLLTEEIMKEISNRVKIEVRESEEFALDSKEPDISETYTDIIL